MAAEKFGDPPPEPILVTRHIRADSIMAEFWQVPLPVMTKRLHVALLQSGISNIDVYEVNISDPSINATIYDYLAFNLIGKIAAADLIKSKFSNLGGDGLVSVDFDSLVIDEVKTRGALMFRLAESVNGIVVHESVKNFIEAAGIDTLTFIPPEEWVG
jgi:hypothetical protein